MDKSKKSLVLGVVGVVFVAISFFMFGFLSLAGGICGALAITNNSAAKKEGEEGSIPGLICGILALVVGIIAFIVYVYGLVVLAQNGALA